MNKKIRKLNEEDHETVFSFIKAEPAKNLFIIGDIEVYGYEQDFQELWGEFDAAGKIKAVLLRYYDNFILYAPGSYDVKGFFEIIKSYEHRVVSGDKEVLRALEPLLTENGYKAKATYFAECTSETLKLMNNEKLIAKVKIATPEEARKVAELEVQIEEFTALKDADERTSQIQKKLEAKAGRSYFIEEDGKAVSVVSSTAENSVSAMLVGVCTAPKFRGKGYISTILGEMMKDLLKEKKSVCLFYDNPQAGKIYHRTGFRESGIWMMYQI